MAYVYIRPEVKKIIQRQWLRLQMKLVLGDYMKSAIWWSKFFGTEEEQFLTLGGVIFLSTRFDGQGMTHLREDDLDFML